MSNQVHYYLFTFTMLDQRKE